VTHSLRAGGWIRALPLALALAVFTAGLVAQQPAPPGPAQTFSRWTSITPDPRQFSGQPGGVLPLAVIGNPTFEAGAYMIYVGPSNPNGMTISRWNTFGPYTLKGHDKMSVTMTIESKRTTEPKLTVEMNPAELLLHYSDTGPMYAMIYVRNTDVSSWQSICVLPVGWNAADRCFGGSNNVIYVPERASQNAATLNTGNGDAVYSQPTAPTTFRLSSPARLAKITNYHWNDGRGAKPGTITVRQTSGGNVGSWPAAGSSGAGGRQDVYWTVEPGIELAPGTYTVADSDPGSWSRNDASGGRGMSEITLVPVGIAAADFAELLPTGVITPTPVDVNASPAGSIEGLWDTTIPGTVRVQLELRRTANGWVGRFWGRKGWEDMADLTVDPAAGTIAWRRPLAWAGERDQRYTAKVTGATMSGVFLPSTNWIGKRIGDRAPR
jgi:hypothetical protein